ncbi:hydrolase [Aeromicrobium flavum]|uniref:Hydrolase n=1 Tax=Aeromicrobium flavum TaxID=416568 RepID=A0A512HSP3_9ACTN|nr:glycerophosphodiester phosphodiesterase family protein [Aeromicrobium flavum]GEO88482.1 hydrolase [Aeromicrobium flavum]
MSGELRIHGHRGQSATHPENTIPALREAVRLGADGVEFDVQPTADGSIVLMHDRSPMRTTNLREVQLSKVGVSVQRFTLAELARLDAGSWKGPQFAGTPVPTLRDVVHALKGTDVRLSVELKPAPVEPRAYVRAVLDELGGRSRVTLMSFDRTLAEAALPVHHAVGLVSRRQPTANDLSLFDEFHVNARRVDARLVERVHEAGGTITAWTVDDARQIERLRALGVDAITTNDVAAARPALV